MTSFLIPKPPITLLLLLVSLTSLATADYFRDTSGNPVVNGGTYTMIRYMMAPDEGPITWGYSNNTRPCPLYVIQSHYPMDDPDTPVNIPYTTITFRTPLKSEFIPLGAPVDIYFNARDTPCMHTLKWSVKPAKKGVNSFYLVAGDENPRHMCSFKVVAAPEQFAGDNAYRLMFCFNGESCLEVGNAQAFFNNEVLGITSQPMENNFWALDFTVSKS